MKSIRYIALFCFFAVNCYGQTNGAVKVKEDDSRSSARFLMRTEQLTLTAATQLTDLAREKASLLGKHVSIAVLDANGQIIIISRGEGVGVHNTEAARRKAFTAASTKTATLILSRNARSSPDTENLASLPELLLLGGGVPIYHNGKVIGAIGVAGGGSPENDDLIGRSASMPWVDIISR